MMRLEPNMLLRQDDRAAVHELEGGLDPEVRGDRVPFGLENIQWIFVALRDPEFARYLVEIHTLRHRFMHTAEIDAELAIEERPEIVITGERERLAAAVDELEVELEREVVV